MNETPKQTHDRLIALLGTANVHIYLARCYLLPGCEGAAKTIDTINTNDTNDRIDNLINSAHDVLTEARALMAAKMKGAW